MHIPLIVADSFKEFCMKVDGRSVEPDGLHFTILSLIRRCPSKLIIAIVFATHAFNFTECTHQMYHGTRQIPMRSFTAVTTEIHPVLLDLVMFNVISA